MDYPSMIEIKDGYVIDLDGSLMRKLMKQQFPGEVDIRFDDPLPDA